jgi:ATP adenylyltransferase
VDAQAFAALWSPWRVEYFKAGGASPDFLLEAAHATDDAAHLVVVRRAHTFLLMNRYPYAVGHLMAVPVRKVGELAELTADEKLELLDLAEHAQRLLRTVIRAQGFNVGLNLGKCAGAGVADHLHLHIVPRWEGDNNFMPVLADTRVLPEALDSLYAKLIAARRAGV